MAMQTQTHARRTAWYRNPWLWAAVLGVVGLTVFRPACARRVKRVPKPPPVTGTLPGYSLTDQHGKPFGSAELAGKVYVVDFIFTRCRSICPRMTAQMKKLHDRLGKAQVPVRLVSISVDPEHDTPPVFLAYAKRHSADLTRWHFLTGPMATVHRLITQGFRLHVGEKEPLPGAEGAPRAPGAPGASGAAMTTPADELFDIAHTSRFVLVDQRGALRGTYPSDDDGIDEVFHRAQHVLHEKR